MKNPPKIMKMRITAFLLMQGLGTEMYPNRGSALWEIVRNGVCAHMKDRKVWTPGVGQIDIFLVDDFPMYPNIRTLIVRDYGRGFTDDDLDRFSYLGPSMDNMEKHKGGSYGGASQKGLGRLAAFALNRKCMVDDISKFSNGFRILTRSQNAGPVMDINMIPELIEKHQTISHDSIDPMSPKLGFLKGVTGSFSAFVIPYSVYDTPEEIIDDLKQRLPRVAEKSFKLFVQGKRVNPPPLASRVNRANDNGTVLICVDKKDSNETGGLWITDLHTGLRVADAVKMSIHLPSPFNSRELVGDIFIKGVLGNQNTSREGLSPQFLRSEFWRKTVCQYLLAQAPEVLAVLGKDEEGKTSVVKDAIANMLDLFSRAWGKPNIPTDFFFSGPNKQEVKNKDGSKEGGGHDAKNGTKSHGQSNRERDPRNGTKNTGTSKNKPQGIVMRIGGKDYPLRLSAMLDHRQLAEAVGGVVEINEKCGVLPSRKEERAEFILSSVLMAIAEGEGLSSKEMVLWMGDRRLELMALK